MPTKKRKPSGLAVLTQDQRTEIQDDFENYNNAFDAFTDVHGPRRTLQYYATKYGVSIATIDRALNYVRYRR